MPSMPIQTGSMQRQMGRQADKAGFDTICTYFGMR